MNIEDFNQVLAEETPVLVDFFSTTCDPCRWLIPILSDVEKYFERNLKIIKINVEQSTDLAHKYNIRSVPTLILFKNSNEIWRMAGFDTAPAMIKTVEQNLAAY